ncbi:MAG: zinc-finger domain-containing protein [Alphaproteobacteria bacterium]|nr:zinc-finger domain-containing protein [Alphaproteobacteria bacterium]MBE8219864.1 zinc-finger domain-containing protein [Alphaproteobacteria bacterium]
MDNQLLKIHNDTGEDRLHIATKRFECIGASPPHDHPHVYLEMGDANEIVCPYCSTKYIYKK